MTILELLEFFATCIDYFYILHYFIDSQGAFIHILNNPEIEMFLAIIGMRSLIGSICVCVCVLVVHKWSLKIDGILGLMKSSVS